MKVNFFLRNKDVYTSRRLLEEAKKLGFNINVYDPLKVSIFGKDLFYDGQRIDDCDLAFLRGSVEAQPREQIVSVAHFYETKGVRTLNNSSSILLSANKWACRTELSRAGIAVPQAVIVSSREELEYAVDFLGGFPIVLKFFYGCSGVGVVYVPEMYTFLSLYDAYKVSGFSFYIEEFLTCAINEVRRFIVAGGEVIADFIMRPSKNDFRSNFARDGMGVLDDGKEDFKQIAVNSVNVCGLVYASVDMVLKNDLPFVLEVNSSPGIEMAESLIQKNLASAILINSTSTR